MHQLSVCDSYCSDGNDAEPYITPAGFQFLLLDTASQIWFFMLQYLETVQVCLMFVSIHVAAHGWPPVLLSGDVFNKPSKLS